MEVFRKQSKKNGSAGHRKLTSTATKVKKHKLAKTTKIAGRELHTIQQKAVSAFTSPGQLQQSQQQHPFYISPIPPL